jgi:hypothetical protein
MTLAQFGNGSGYVYLTLPDGVTIVANIDNTADAYQQVQQFLSTSSALTDSTLQTDATFGYRVFGSTTGSVGSLAGTTELTRFLVARPSNAPKFKVAVTIAAGVVTTDRVSNDMLLVVDTEGAAAADNLDTITIADVVDNDVITITGANAARIVTVTGSGNITLANTTNFATGNNTKKIVLRYQSGSWFEDVRANTLPTVLNTRASSVPTPISGVNTTALTNGGGTINLEPGVDKGYQVYTGTVNPLLASWTIQIQAAPSTPYLDGDTMIVDYRGIITPNTPATETITIFGQTLTDAQMLAGRIVAKATYKLSNTTWYYTFFENNGDGTGGSDMASVTYVDNNFEPSLGNPAASGYVLSSTSGGTRSWLPVFSTGELYFDGATSATIANTTETTLKSYTLAANTLSTDGDSLTIKATGVVAANANTKTIKIKIGGFEIIPHTAFITAPNGLTWGIDITLVRTASNNSRTTGTTFTFTNAATGAVLSTIYDNTIGVDFTTALAIIVTGTNGVATANDIVSTSLFVSKIAKQS